MRSYFGWLKFCNSKNLLKKIEKEIDLKFSNWDGKYANITNYCNKNIKIIEVISHNKYFEIHFVYNNIPYTYKSLNKNLFKWLQKQKFT